MKTSEANPSSPSPHPKQPSLGGCRSNSKTRGYRSRLAVPVLATLITAICFVAASYLGEPVLASNQQAAVLVERYQSETDDSDDSNADSAEAISEQSAITETTTITESLSAPVDAVSDEESDEATPEQEAPAESKQQAISGTIIANRTDWPASFFVEGELRRLEPQLSIGVDLPRAEGGLNLFNCEADAPKDDPSCFWDPYLVEQNGFYEILKSATEGGDQQKLILERARAPAGGQIWVQNRTGLGELIFWEDSLITLAPSALHEFDLNGAALATFYMRSCVVLGEDFSCEWLPQNVESGIYYSMDEVINPANQLNSQYSSIRLTPIQNADGSVIEAAPDSLCTLLVPSLNIRSGPGLQYQILSQAFASTSDDVVVRVIGRDEGGIWLATASDIIDGGWIVYSPDLISCTGDLGQLPIAEITDGRLAPVQAEAPAAPDGETAEGDVEGETAEGEGEEEAEAAIEETPPKGQALLIIENAFEADVRFTFDGEIDLKPGERTSVVVNAGRIQFSVSSAWRGGMAGNAEFLIEPDQTKRMFLYFVTDPKDSDKWLMRYE